MSQDRTGARGAAEAASAGQGAAAYLIDHVVTGAGGSHREVLPAECADRAVGWIRIQARRYGAGVPEDHPLWDWTVSRYSGTEYELRSTGSAAVAFDIGEGRVSWTVRRAYDAAAPVGCAHCASVPGTAAGAPGAA